MTSWDEQFLAALRREKIRLGSRFWNMQYSEQERTDAGFTLIAVVKQIVALETRIAQTAERAALLAELDAHLEQRT